MPHGVCRIAGNLNRSWSFITQSLLILHERESRIIRHFPAIHLLRIQPDGLDLLLSRRRGCSERGPELRKRNSILKIDEGWGRGNGIRGKHCQLAVTECEFRTCSPQAHDT